jgi:hypothetical protein
VTVIESVQLISPRRICRPDILVGGQLHNPDSFDRPDRRNPPGNRR